MDGERAPAGSHRLSRLAEQMHDKRYRDGYVAAHTRRTLAQQMRKFRGEESQAAFAEVLGKRQTVVSRLENPSYSGWTLRTLFEVAQALDVAVLVRFVDFPTFLKYSDDLSESALRPQPYDKGSTDRLLEGGEYSAEKAFFSSIPQQTISSSALNAMAPSQMGFGRMFTPAFSMPANESENLSPRFIGEIPAVETSIGSALTATAA